METLKVTATRIDEYEISFDPAIINEQWMQEYRESFTPVHDLKNIAEALAFQIMRFGSGDFYEGFGRVKMLRSNGSEKAQFGPGLKMITADQYAPGIVVKLLEEDDQHEFEIEEVAAAPLT